MKWIVIAITIIIYYFLLTVGLNYLLQDEFLINAGGEQGNFSLLDTSNLSFTSEFDEEDEHPDETDLRLFPRSLRIMFGFKTPIPDAVPEIISILLSFFNWFLMIIFGIAVYRLLNPFAS